VKDVVSANMRLTDLTLPPTDDLDQRAFNVGTGIETSVVQLAEALGRAAGYRPELIHADARPGELKHSCLDTAKLRQTGWQPAQSIEDGLRITYEFVKNGEKGC
jgi:UDP-glucose 4-epimerase